MKKGIFLIASMLAFHALSANASMPEIFGQANIKVLKESDNKNVVGKGYAADYYGYYGHSYAQMATYYASQGYQYKNADLYYNAYIYATYSADFLYRAHVAQRSNS